MNSNKSLLWVIAALMIAAILPSTLALAQNYTDLSGPPQARNVNDITTDGTGATLYACDKSYLFKSTNGGGSWATTSSQKASPLVTVCKSTAAATVVVGVTNYLYQSADGGASWSTGLFVSGMTPLRLAVSPLNTDQMYLGRQAS